MIVSGRGGSGRKRPRADSFQILSGPGGSGRKRLHADSEQGTLKTRIACIPLQQWTIPNVDCEGVTPLFVFDAYDAFKIMLRLKVRPTDDDLTFFIQTQGTYGSLPKKLYMTLTVNKSSALFNFVPDTKWMQVFDCNKFNGTATIGIQVDWPDNDSSMLSASGTNFANLWNMPGADITIESADGKSKKVHKSVLFAKSNVLRAKWQKYMLKSKSNHLEIPELYANYLDMFISYLYHGSVEDFNLNCCLNLLTIADKYNIKDLLVKCGNAVSKNLTNDNVIDVYFKATLHNLNYLRDATISYIHIKIADILLTPTWNKTKNADFFKLIYTTLPIKKQVIIGQDKKCDTSAWHCLTVDFPVDIQKDKEVVHYMTVFPERDSVYFRLRFSEKTMLLSTCYQSADIGCLTGVTFKNIKFDDSAPKQITLHNMNVNSWYDLACCQDLYIGNLVISFQTSYDLKCIPKESAFAELLTDLDSADMRLELSDGTIRQVHRSVLIARNMNKMVDECDSKDHVKLSNISILALDAFIQFVYTGDEKALDTDSCAELLPISHIYNFNALKYQCEIKLKTTIDVANVMKLLSLAVSIKSIFLEQWILDYVYQNKSDIVKTEDWRNCNDSEALRKIIEYYVHINESLVSHRSISAT